MRHWLNCVCRGRLATGRARPIRHRTDSSDRRIGGRVACSLKQIAADTLKPFGATAAEIVDLADADFGEMIFRSRAVSPPASGCSRNRSRPTVRCRFRGGNSGANVRLSRSTTRNILPSRDALPPAVDGKSMFQPRSRRLLHSPALRSCCRCIRYRQWILCRAFRC